jgi:hypothetical protein
MARPTLPATYNNLITSYVNDDLLVEDEISSTKYRFIYSVLPTLTQYNLGGRQIFAFTEALGVGAGEYKNSSAISVTPGIYIVEAYARFRPTVGNNNKLYLGINTTTSSYSDIYSPSIDTNLGGTVERSIRYTTILSVSTTRNFYFIFNSQFQGNLITGSFNGEFVRIA